MIKKIILAMTIVLTAGAADVIAQQSTPTPPATATPGKVWTIDEILSEASPKPPRGKVKYCRGGRFKPCVCPGYVAREARYRPAVAECGGSAAVILSGKYRSAFSAVVRDTENRDRWPVSGFGKCSAYERDVLGLNKCSAFKVQKKLRAGSGKKQSIVHCLGASGYSKLFNKVSRITVKLADIPGSNADPLVRWCLNSPKQPLN